MNQEKSLRLQSQSLSQANLGSFSLTGSGQRRHKFVTSLFVIFAIKPGKTRKKNMRSLRRQTGTQPYIYICIYIYIYIHSLFLYVYMGMQRLFVGRTLMACFPLPYYPSLTSALQSLRPHCRRSSSKDFLRNEDDPLS